MAREEGLKKIELKVSVDCCEGCKKKVLRALSIKGVLKMEIHPTEPLVTVTGNIDEQTLVKRLAKYGKLAEVLPAEDKRPEKRATKMTENMEPSSKDTVDEGKVVKKVDEGKVVKKTAQEHEKSPKCCEANKSKQSEKVEAEKVAKYQKVKESYSEDTCAKQTEEALKNVDPAKTTTTITAASITAPIPQMNCIIHPGSMQGAVFTQASLPRIFYPMEQYIVPITYPMANTLSASTYPAQVTMVPPNSYPQSLYPAAETLVQPPCYYNRDPPHLHSTQPLPPRMTDYFNDDNTASCQVM